MSEKTFDVLIIGGGVAGISAALWCDELGLESILIEAGDELGGQLLWTYNSIKNHLGVEAENGKELRDIFVEQIVNRKFTFRLNSKVAKIDSESNLIYLENNKKISAKVILIATGVRRRTLGIKGEKEFIDRGIIKSGKKDKDLVKDKKVLIVGGGDAALENTEILSDTAAEIILIHRSKEFSARAEFLESARQNEKVKILTDTVLKEISGTGKVEKVKLADMANEKVYSINVDAILFRIGVAPNTDFLPGEIELDEKGYIKIDSRCQTNLKGIYAVGDVANPVSPTISSATGMGATAIKAAYSELDKT